VEYLFSKQQDDAKRCAAPRGQIHIDSKSEVNMESDPWQEETKQAYSCYSMSSHLIAILDPDPLFFSKTTKKSKQMSAIADLQGNEPNSS